MAGPHDVSPVSRAEYDLAREAFERHDGRTALDHCERALKEDSANADAAYLAAVVLMGFCAADDTSPDCRYPDAETYARKALDADAQHRDARNALGVILVHEGRADDAIEALEPLAHDILYVSPEKAWGNLGWAYLQADRLDDAIQALKRAVAASPVYCVGNLHLGRAYAKKGDHAAARQAFTRALAVQRGDCSRLQEAFLGRAEASSALGSDPDAAKDLEQCRDIAPDTSTGRACSKQLQLLKQRQNGG